ncbi:MAG: membrane dipeptidase [Desulfosarcinaceae bacterium]|nr:membrane dipeptidase [Desulfosarcinaceae bacterium]
MDAVELHKTAIVADTHQEILDAYVYEFLLQEDAAVRGEVHVFDRVYKPVLEGQGVNLVQLAVGGDHVAQVMYSASELRFWDAHKKLDVLNSELEAGCESFILCRDASDIDRALQAGKFAILATIAGGRVLHGKPNLNLRASLRSLYRMGLRGLQLTGNGRNRLADGVAQTRTRGKLTGFGEQVVTEAERLGMMIDTAQLSDPGFFDLIALTNRPVIDSHSAAAAVCDHPRNISDRRIRAIAERGGVVGISFWAALVNQDKAHPDIGDLLRHVDHIADLVGIAHVALGPDFYAYQTPMNREVVRGFANRGPDFCTFDRKTPTQSEKYPGWIEGIWYGRRSSDFIAGIEQHEAFPGITAALLAHGYSEAECRLILGENFLRVCRQLLDTRSG